jgi:predicted Zn-ribbon and HTH transcriptional regulator
MTSIASNETISSARSNTTTIGRGREGQTEYIISNVPIARGLNYGAARSQFGGGLSNKTSGLGAGERYGMSAGSVKGLGRKVKPLKLQTGATVYVDLLCNKCGYENLPSHKRLRCDTCGVPLPQLHPDDAYAGKNTLQTYTGQDAFSPISSIRLERKNNQRKILEDIDNSNDFSVVVNDDNNKKKKNSNNETLNSREQQLVVMSTSMNTGATSRKQACGGLGRKRSGTGPGARHGMAAGAVWHLPASTRSIRLQDGNIITVDVLCRKCGFEQRPDWNGLRCQNCKKPLNQLGSLLTNHQFRAVGWHTSYKNKQLRKARAKKRKEEDEKESIHLTHYGSSHGEYEQIFGFSGQSIRNILKRSQAEDDESDVKSNKSVKPKRPKPSLTNLRAETNDVIKDWVCAIDSSTGDDYFYNRKTRVVTWNCPLELKGLL